MNENLPAPDDLEMATEAFIALDATPGPPVEVNQQLLRQLLRVEEEANTVPFVLREGDSNMRRFSSLAAAVFALIGIGIIYIVVSSTNENSAYAGMIKEMKNIRTMSYLTRVSMQGKVTGNVKTYVLSDKQIREEMFETVQDVSENTAPNCVLIHDEQKRKALTLFPEEKKAKILDKSQAPFAGNRINLFEKFRTMREEDAVYEGEEEVDGKAALKYSYQKTNGYYLVWLDPHSLLPVRVVITGSKTTVDSTLRIEMTNFVWNPELNESLFRTDVPEGYQLEEEALAGDLDEQGRQALVRILEFYVRTNDGDFPETFNMFVYTSLMEKMKKDDATASEQKEFRKRFFAKGLGRSEIAAMSDEKFAETAREFAVVSARGAGYLYLLMESNHWNFEGKGVRLGDGEKIVAWWYPKNDPDKSQSLAHVLYGDLSIKRMAVAELPVNQ